MKQNKVLKPVKFLKLNRFKIVALLIILNFQFSIFNSSAQSVLNSPDGNFKFSFTQKPRTDGAVGMYYSLTFRGIQVIEESKLGVAIDNHLIENAMGIPRDSSAYFCDNLQLIDSERTTFDETWRPVYGERNEYRNHYNELILKFRKGGDGANSATDNGYDKRRAYYINLVIRAYNEGVAFCYAFPEAENGLFLHITGEQTQFALPKGTMAYYEQWAQGPYSLAPIDSFPDECERPMVAVVPAKKGRKVYAAIAEAALTDFPRMKLRTCSPPKKGVLRASLFDSADVITPYQTPWRVIIAAETPAQLAENNSIILNLNKPCAIAETDWIRPGKVIRVTQLNQAAALKCVDFAAAHGLQYVHLDAGWYGKEFTMEADATKVSAERDLNIKALVDYAAAKNIGVWLYVNQRALSRQLDEILPLYRQWGVKGIKFGFVQVGSQMWTTWLHNAVRKCADYGLMVDIHDEYRPTGFSRTYPNLLTQEGIRGNEEMPDATHNAILPFTRFLAGAGDYTVCYYNNRIKTTHAHQLALAVLYYSPLQFLFWYDTPDMYGGEPEIAFFERVKTVWDDTKVLAGEIGEYCVTARRSDDRWFVGAITNVSARTVEIPLAFLEKGKKYTAKIFYDDNAVNTKTKVGVKMLQVTGKSVLKERLQASGGVAVEIMIND